ncbi:16S rRNA (cytosine(1402)-N(4))-methyltransferase RsmH [Bombiscardovia coagulans]|uniref:Ribosomal RNA small subunit methyltransferase H n=1 Tax=Bombiscardovia coagulans TaxID=686666 RepID=A0A261EP90_9BIFI|nr:16S rRNA (cytosine(1402)-N(4))-methyltransferase RsmH [Bombiscardovia coagulans]OZG48671.1 16S rRNA (cytosine(1402)-N(4))-methyltransferase [Bombiscardovia coagulans]
MDTQLQSTEKRREHLNRLQNIHKPVLLDECVHLVVPAASQPGSWIVDCTEGLAGHTTAFLKAAPNARVLGIDRDREALSLAQERLREEGLEDRFLPVHAPFDQFEAILADVGISQVSAVFMDLGLSSLQIDERDRGFSYNQDAPLDMRMDSGQELTAAYVVATYSCEDLTRIFKTYGEERFANKIARKIVEVREKEPLTSSAQLSALVDQCIPRSHRAPGNPAKRVFQALRIEVNGELDKLVSTLPQAAAHLQVGGRLVVESYHSLEDRAVKQFMASGLRVNLPPGLPVIPEQAQPFFADLTHGALKASPEQVTDNSRSASVRLRGVELTRTIPAHRVQLWRTEAVQHTHRQHLERRRA